MEIIHNPTEMRIAEVNEALQQFMKLNKITLASVEYRLPDGTWYTTKIEKMVDRREASL